MNNEGAGTTFHGNGWSFRGGSRVSSKTSWNLLGGYMEFDMDTSGVNPGVNTNFYTSSPNRPNCGSSCYCDIQRSFGKPSCMEMDIIEVNGHCAMATTIHTFATDGRPNNPNCDRWGCGSVNTLPNGGKFTIKAMFGEDGTLAVTMNGTPIKGYSPMPSAASNEVVVKTMRSIGAVIESSQWFGWAPAGSQCPGGSGSGLYGSQLKISNVKVRGKVVQGPVPTKC